VISKLAIFIVIIFVAMLLFAMTKPDTFVVQRSIRIKAPPERVFALIDDFHKWTSWAPQDKEDPTMKRSYSGAASGVGSISEWSSQGSAGKGRMEIVESVPSSRIRVKVDFVKPFEAHNMNEFTLQADGDFTNVTWSMHGTNLYIMKVMSLFTSMDRVAGKHFESGLQELKGVAER
jgi:uncharacterized protein YndB with AHSA1/START domain